MGQFTFTTSINRTLCDVLEEMRNSVKTLNFGYMSGLIEEAQSMANRMEAKLMTIRDWDSYNTEVKQLKKEVKELERRKDLLEDEVGDSQYEEF